MDITTTGATLKANDLKILSDGEMLASQAQLSASLKADWSDEALQALKAILDLIEARQLAKRRRILSGNRDLSDQADRFGDEVKAIGPNLVMPTELVNSAAIQLSENGLASAWRNPSFYSSIQTRYSQNFVVRKTRLRRYSALYAQCSSEMLVFSVTV